MLHYLCEPLWKDETAFIVAGGPSVLSQDLSLLEGRRVIVINSSVFTYPRADFLFFADARWYRFVPENARAADEFKGVVITTSKIKAENVRVMIKGSPPGLAQDRQTLTVKRTSLTGAINLAVHLGVNRIVLLGADGRKIDGRTHHHKQHKWPTRAGCWDEHKKELLSIAPSLAALGIKVWNASPGSAWADIWPVKPLIEVLNDQINCL